jgi:hypothetical protein
VPGPERIETLRALERRAGLPRQAFRQRCAHVVEKARLGLGSRAHARRDWAPPLRDA